MSYNKTNWQTGDIVTADKLNNIENGIENASIGPLIVEAEIEQGQPVGIDKSYNELFAAVSAGRNIILLMNTPMGEAKALTTCNLMHGEIEPGEESYFAAFASISFTATDPDEPMVVQ